MKCQARISDASGSQAVPEPMRFMGISNGRSGIMPAMESIAMESTAMPDIAWGSTWASTGKTGRAMPSVTAIAVMVMPNMIDPPSRDAAEQRPGLGDQLGRGCGGLLGGKR